MPIYKKINVNFFKKWTPEMSYVLGFIFADGNIICTKRNTWFLSIQITDNKILKEIKNAMKSSHAISERKDKLNCKKLYRLQIGNKSMCNDLLKLGLTERKSKTILLPKIPLKYFSSFLRGYFDGDGGVWVGPRNLKQNNKTLTISTFFTSGSKNFLMSLKEVLKKNGLSGGCLVKKERGYDLKYSIRDSLILYKIMYNSKSSLFLARKKERFDKYICSRSSTG